MKYNQPCFDAIFFNKMGNIDFFQVTTGKNHQYKFKDLVPFLEHFSFNGMCKFRFIILTNNHEFILDARHISDINKIKKYDKDWSIDKNMFIVYETSAVKKVI